MNSAKLIPCGQQTQLKKEFYVRMDGHFSGRCAGGRRVGIHWHRRGGNGNREGSVLYFSDFVFGIVDSLPYCQIARQQGELNLEGTLCPEVANQVTRTSKSAWPDILRMAMKNTA